MSTTDRPTVSYYYVIATNAAWKRVYLVEADSPFDALKRVDPLLVKAAREERADPWIEGVPDGFAYAARRPRRVDDADVTDDDVWVSSTIASLDTRCSVSRAEFAAGPVLIDVTELPTHRW